MTEVYRAAVTPRQLREQLEEVELPGPVETFLSSVEDFELRVRVDDRLWECRFRTAGEPETPPDALRDLLEDRFRPAVEGLRGVQVIVDGTEAVGPDRWLEVNWSALRRDLARETPASRSLLGYARPTLEDDDLIVEVPDEEWVTLARDKHLPARIQAWMKDRRGGAPPVRFREGDFGEDIERDAKQIEEENQRERRDRQRRQAARREKKEASVLLGENIREDPVELRSLNGGDGSTVTVQGELIQCEFLRTGRGKKNLVRGVVSDRTDSVLFKVFTEENESPIDAGEGDWIRLRGRVQKDAFNGGGDTVVIPRDVNRIEPMIREDEAPRKRVELHCHSRMSALDAVADVEELVERAAYWDHPAIAITDHGVAHGFPEAARAGRERGVKVIFGVEGYLVQDPRPLVLNRRDAGDERSLQEDVVLVVGRYSHGDPSRAELEEVAALRVRGGEAVDRLRANLTDETFPPRLADWLSEVPTVAPDADRLRRGLERHDVSPSRPILHLGRLAEEARERAGDGVVEEAREACRGEEDPGARLEAARALLEACTGVLEEPLTVGYLDGLRPQEDLKGRTYHIILLAKNRTGLINLYRLISESHTEQFYKRPRLLRSQIDEHRVGLLVGSACEAGEIFQSVVRGESDEEVRRRMRFYDLIEIQPVENNRFMLKEGGPYREITGEGDLEKLASRIYRLAEEVGRPVVGTGDVHFLDPEDEVFRRILQTGQDFEDAENQPPLYYRTTDEMIERFDFLGEEAALKVSVENPRRVADQCEAFDPVPDGFYPPRVEGAAERFRAETTRAAHERYGDPLPDPVARRLEEETRAVVDHDFSNLYVMAADLVQKSHDDGYLVGSRGSVGSSFTAFLMDITEVNPLPAHYRCEDCGHVSFPDDAEGDVGVDLPERDCPRCARTLRREGFNIPFEVFCGFEGEKIPDIDLNFSGEYQQEMFRYVQRRFGEENVFRAGTIDTIAERTASGFVNGYLQDRGLHKRGAEKIRLKKGITGVKQNTSQHPGGMIIVPEDRSIYEFTPINYPANDREAPFRTTHFDYHAMEDQLVKLDVLGHDDPTQLRHLEELTGVHPGEIPLDDPETMRLFSDVSVLGVDGEQLEVKTGVLGVPEFGTHFVRGMVEETRPETFADLLRISGLSHGEQVWQGNARELIRGGTADLQGVISCRDDIMNRLIDHGMPERMAFGIMEDVRKGRGLDEEQVRRMKAHGVPDWYVESCERISYLFPKAHAAAYVIMAFRIAYFKVHHPVAFYASYFTLKTRLVDARHVTSREQVENRLRELEAKMNRNEDTQRDRQEHTVLEVMREAYLRGVSLDAPRLVESDPRRFTLRGDDVLLSPYVTVEGLGGKVAETVKTAYEERPFSSVEDALNRTSLNRRVVEHAREQGFFEGLPDEENYDLFD